MEERMLAEILFWLLACISIFDKNYRILTWQKWVFFNCFATKQCLSMLKMLSMTPTLALTGSHFHSLAYSGPLSLLLSNFTYTALDRLTVPLLGSHRRSHDDALYPALVWGNFLSPSKKEGVLRLKTKFQMPKWCLMGSLTTICRYFKYKISNIWFHCM